MYKKYGIHPHPTVLIWLRKFGKFDWDNHTPHSMQKPPQQQIMELEDEVKLPKKQKALLEREAYIANKKVVFFDMMINIAENEYQIDIPKNSTATQSITSAEQKNKL